MRIMIGLAIGTTLLAPAAPALAQGATADRGLAVFTEQKCTLCHSIAGKVNKKGALDGVGSKLKPAEIREWIVDPLGMAKKAQPAPTRKPAMTKKAMPDKDVDALVALLSGLKK